MGFGMRGEKSRSLTRKRHGVRDDRFSEIACVTNHFAFFLAFFFDVGLLFDLDAGRGFCGAVYPWGWERDQSQALRTMSSRLAYCGCQWSSRLIFSELATRIAGSPGRRSTSRTGIGWPVTRRAVSMTSRTLKPFPLPRL